MEFVETGIPNLDLVLGGGLVAGSLTMVTGAPGCGKTILTQQVAFHAARQGREVLVLTTLSEPHTKLLAYLRTLDFFDEALIGERIELLNVYRQLTEDFSNVSATIIRLVREQHASLLVIDSFDSVRGLAPSDMAAKELIYELSAGLGLLGVTVIIVGTHAAQPATLSPELAIADSILALNQELYGVRSVRSLEVPKMRGAAQRNGRHSYRIDSAGVAVFPRLETLEPSPEIPLGAERVPLGLAELDGMMRGGPLRGDSTAIVGNPSTGKTILALQFLLEGQRRGERGLFVGFQETEQQLTAKLAALGLDLSQALAGGQEILHRVPSELDADELAMEIRARLGADGQGGPDRPGRLVVDTLDDLLRGVLEEQRRVGFFAALTASLRNAGVTTCFTQDLAIPIGDPRAPLDPFAAYADNIVLLRHLEYRAQLHRIVSVVKMRSSDHDRALREFTIGQGGLTILSADESESDLLDDLDRE